MGVDEDNLKAAFEQQDIEFEDPVLVQECIRLANKYNISFTSFARQWDLFSVNGDYEQSKDSLKKFETVLKVDFKSPKKPRLISRRGTVENTDNNNNSTRGDFSSSSSLSSSSDSLVQKTSRTPTQLFNKDSIGNLKKADKESLEAGFGVLSPLRNSRGSRSSRDGGFHTPKKGRGFRLDFSSPSARSVRPSPATGRYASRINKGSIVQTLNGQISNETTSALNNLPICDIRSFGPSIRLTNETFRYMYERDDQVFDALESQIQYIQKVLLEKIRKSISENQMSDVKQQQDEEPGDDEEDMMADKIVFSSLKSTSQEAEYYVGRVCGEDSDKIQRGSVILQGDQRLSFGAKVKLNLSDVQTGHSLFSGQIIAVKGTNDGMTLKVEEIFRDASPNHVEVPPMQLIEWHKIMDEQPLKVMITSGPYHTNEGLEFTDSAFEDLFVAVKKHIPNVLVLVGPFLSVDHPLVKNCQLDKTFEDTFRDVLSEFIQKMSKETRTEVFIIPSNSDASHPFVFPQPPFSRTPEMEGNIKCLTNPSQFQINDVTFAVTSQNVMKDLMTYSTQIGGDSGLKRMGILTEHLIQQRNLSPVFPSSSGVNIDSSYYEYLQLKQKPDFIIWTSQTFKYMAESLCEDSVIAINPGPIVKFGGGGTFAVITVAPLTKQQRETEEGLDETIFKQPPPLVAKRSRVDIIKI